MQKYAPLYQSARNFGAFCLKVYHVTPTRDNNEEDDDDSDSDSDDGTAAEIVEMPGQVQMPDGTFSDSD